MVMNVKDGLDLVEQLSGYEAFFILDDNSVLSSSGINDFLH